MKRIQTAINQFLGGNVPKGRVNTLLLSSFLALVVIIGLAAALIITANSKQPTIAVHKTETVTPNEKITLNDNSIGEIWLAALEGVRKNTYQDSGFTADSTFKYYSEDGKAASLCGVDVSTFQGDIDWKKVKVAGVDFAMIRIGGRGYTGGEIYFDDKFDQNVKNAQQAGVKVGAYFFSQAISVAEAKEEAEFVIDKIKNYNLEYPVAFDWEVIGTAEARTDVMTPQELTDCAKAFCNLIEESGNTPMIYVSKRLGYYKYDLSQLADISLWYVEYDYTPSFYYHFDMWQYSESGTVDGIQGEVDLNIGFKEFG